MIVQVERALRHRCRGNASSGCDYYRPRQRWPSDGHYSSCGERIRRCCQGHGCNGVLSNNCGRVCQCTRLFITASSAADHFNIVSSFVALCVDVQALAATFTLDEATSRRIQSNGRHACGEYFVDTLCVSCGSRHHGVPDTDCASLSLFVQSGFPRAYFRVHSSRQCALFCRNYEYTSLCSLFFIPWLLFRLVGGLCFPSKKNIFLSLSTAPLVTTLGAAAAAAACLLSGTRSAKVVVFLSRC